MYFIVEAVNLVIVDNIVTGTVKTIILPVVRMLLEVFNRIHNLERGAGRIGTLRHTVQKCSDRWILIHIGCPVFSNLRRVKIRFRDHCQYIAGLGVRDNNGSLVCTHRIIRRLLDYRIQRRHNTVTAVFLPLLIEGCLLGK